MWQKAGEITYYIIDRVSNERANNDFIDLVNIPEEFDGAFIFRNGFKEALLINNVDTSGIRILRMMTSIEARKLDKTIIHSAKHGTTFVPPNTYIIDDSIITVVEPFTLDTSYYRIRYSSSLLYWNKHQLINLSY
ncbi:MAG: hypothetical protein IPG01_02885 [Chitinophagaceae bacterium]|nr:hypothetical protein [Chitinophagaceae bacterium]